MSSKVDSHQTSFGVKERTLKVPEWHSWPIVARLRHISQSYMMNVPAQIGIVWMTGLSCVLFVVSTYLPGLGVDIEGFSVTRGIMPTSASSTLIIALVLIDQLINIVFMIDFVLNALASDYFTSYVLSPFGFADLISSIPFSTILLYAPSDGGKDVSGLVRTLKFLKTTRVSRLTRLVRMRRESHGLSGSSGNEEVRAEIMNSAVVLFMLIFVTVNVMMILEGSESGDEFYIGCDDDAGNCGDHLRWHDALYFAIVTLTTVGYGDIGPSNNASRMFVSAVIVINFSFLGRIIQNISDAAERSSKWRTHFVPQGKVPHIILAGAPHGYYLKFFSELFSDTQRLKDEPMPSICVLSQGDPPEELKLLVAQLYPALQYVDGSVLRQHDLKRAGAADAQSIMVTMGSGSKDPTASGADNGSVLSAISIFRFFQQLHQQTKLAKLAEKEREMRAEAGASVDGKGWRGTFEWIGRKLSLGALPNVDIDGTLPASMSMLTSFKFRRSALPDFVLPHLSFQVVERATKDHLIDLGLPLNVVATREFRNSLTAVGALVPGIIAFFGNCIRSNPGITVGKEKWKSEYMSGASHEVYIVETELGFFDDNIFEGMKFSEMVQHLYAANRSLLLGLGWRTVSIVRGRCVHVVLNPSDLILFNRTEVVRLYVLGKSRESVDNAMLQFKFLRTKAVLAARASGSEQSINKSKQAASPKHKMLLGKVVSKLSTNLPWFVDNPTGHGTALSEEDAALQASLSSVNEAAAAAAAVGDKGVGSPAVTAAAKVTLDRLEVAAEAVRTLKKALARLAVEEKEKEGKGTSSGAAASSASSTGALVASTGAMIGSAAEAIKALPHRPPQEPAISSGHSSVAAAKVQDFDKPFEHHRHLEGHIVIDAFAGSVGSVVSILVGLRRMTDLEVVILISSNNPKMAHDLREQLRMLNRSRFGRIAGRLLANNVHLVTSHAELNKDSLREVGLSSAVSLILCRSVDAELKYDHHSAADNQMLVNSSIVCHALIDHYHEIETHNEKEGGGGGGGSGGDGQARRHSSPSLAAASSNSGQPKKQPSRRVSKVLIGDLMATDQGMEQHVEHHFDLHTVHQMFSDKNLGFLSQSTEVPHLSQKELTVDEPFNLLTALLDLKRKKSIEESKREEISEASAVPARPRRPSDVGNSPPVQQRTTPDPRPPTRTATAQQQQQQQKQQQQQVVEEEEEEEEEEHVVNLTSASVAKLVNDDLFNFPVFAAGRVYTDSMMELLMAQAYFNPSEINFWEALFGIGDHDEDMRFGKDELFDHSLGEAVSFSTELLQITQINVPKSLVGKRYADVLKHSATQGNIALGLYRPSGTKGATMPYMVTNPPCRTKVVTGDRVLVIRSAISFLKSASSQ